MSSEHTGTPKWRENATAESILFQAVPSFEGLPDIPDWDEPGKYWSDDGYWYDFLPRMKVWMWKRWAEHYNDDIPVNVPLSRVVASYEDTNNHGYMDCDVCDDPILIDKNKDGLSEAYIDQKVLKLGKGDCTLICNACEEFMFGDKYNSLQA